MNTSPETSCNIRISEDKVEGLGTSPAFTSPGGGAPRENHFTPLNLGVLPCEMGVITVMMISLPSHKVVVSLFKRDRMTLLLLPQAALSGFIWAVTGMGV